jgi:hypothetical protein
MSTIPTETARSWDDTEIERQNNQRVFITKQLERRGTISTNALDLATKHLVHLENSFARITERILKRRFNIAQFTNFIEMRPFIAHTLMKEGLDQLQKLPVFFTTILSHPETIATVNSLPRFKAMVKSDLQHQTPAYIFSGDKIVSLFSVNHTLIIKQGKLASVGYDFSFIDHVRQAIKSLLSMIAQMKHHEPLIHKARTTIVEALVHPNDRSYGTIRLQYELYCHVFTSILTTAPFQYLDMAMGIATSIASCYEY